MSMFVAINSQQQLVTIQDAFRGLACACSCIACGEALIARKGEHNEHHFAHYSNKESCYVGRETLLHLFGKQVIRESMGLQMPFLPDHPPKFGDLSSWWDFEQVEEEPWLDCFRPDLVATLRDGQRVLIEIAVTSFIDETKLAKIKAADLWALEIDLSYFLNGEIGIPSEELRQLIVHCAERKCWVYPESKNTAAEAMVPATSTASTLKQLLTEHRFTIEGLWVTAKELPSGSLAVKSLVYSPQMRDMFKAMARDMGGYYKASHKNWIFPPVMTPLVLAQLRSTGSPR